ncbi:phosphate propanoyltransferase [Virgibacillus sp. W0430]|uniref:phosphate propanoyltransferase n=1 Tax=Virgibacillus sp. W0430 TaxID=3391580 RepID=UPI003F4715A2
MDHNQLVNIVKETVSEVLMQQEQSQQKEIPIGVSNRHVHLSKAAVERLFGKGYELTKLKPLSQPGQFACNETVTVIGPKGKLQNVRILGPARGDTQVEVSLNDGFVLGIKPPIRNSGDIEGTPAFTLQGPKGQLKVKKGLICAARHIHMHTDEATYFGVNDGDYVDVYLPGERSVTLHQTLIRVSPNFKLEMHIDFDEANAANVKNGQVGFLMNAGAE